MKKNLGTTFVVLALVSWLVAPTLSPAQSEGTRALLVKGAGIAADQVLIWARSFTTANPEIPVVVIGSDDTTGFQALLDKEADIAVISRDLTPSEQAAAQAKGLRFAEKRVGYAALALVTGPTNPVNELTLLQLRSIFTGKYLNWNQVGGPDSPIRAMTVRASESGGSVFFQANVLGNEPYGTNVGMAGNWMHIVRACSSDATRIGVVPALLARKEGGKILAVKRHENDPAVLPSYQAVMDHSYPISMPIALVWDDQSKDARIKAFVDFCLKSGFGL
jgi:phosphate transport system substrate-binding protein